jgi:RHS repeat-associated protein
VDKAQYDGAGRQTAAYLTDGGGDSTWADAGNVTGDNVLEQTQTQYDADGNPILTSTTQRNHDETATGALGSPNTTPKARVYYAAAYYDAANRLTASVDVGTNGGTAYTRPSTVPAASDTVLVTALAYNAAGWLDTTTDPRGIVHKDVYDNLGQVTKSIDAYTGGPPGTSTDNTTEFTYDGDGHTLTVQADQPGGGVEQTKYVYGVTTAGGSDVNSNDLLAAVYHPDPTTGQPSSAQADRYTVNALGQAKTVTDRNGNVHTLSYDILGRPVSDQVTTLGAGVDGSVRRQDTAYDSQGNPYLFTSYADTAGTTVVSQVQRSFNGLGQLTAEYQEHGGAVNTATSPSVQYGYTLMAGGANHSRPTTLTYPNGRVLNYNYAAGVDASISRLTSLSDNSGTLEQYSYLGLDTVVRRAHPQPGVDLTYIKQAGENNGDAGDQYTGLDRFGRVVDQRWLQTSSGTATDRFQYGYDRNGNALYRQNLVNTAFGELYHANGATQGYDNLNQLTGFARGVLSDTNSDGVPDTIASPSHSQSFTLDAQGNFQSVTTDGSQQNRTHNQQNEVTAVGGASLTYDSNGNLTTDETGKTLVYGAWNRLVQVKAGGTTLASYRYDALGRRIQETEGGTTTDLYYDAGWQVLEERVGGQARVQYVWSPVAADTLVERDRDPTGGGTLSERLYVQQDANGDVTALVNPSGQVVERYVYDPYGAVTVLSAGWATESGSQYAWRYLFQGGRFDWGTGYYNFRHRDYSPGLGRWLSNDPLGFGAGDVNLYRFVADDPTSNTDPSGLFWIMTPPPEREVRRSIELESVPGTTMQRVFLRTTESGLLSPDRVTREYIGAIDPSDPARMVESRGNRVPLSTIVTRLQLGGPPTDWARWIRENASAFLRDGEWVPLLVRSGGFMENGTFVRNDSTPIIMAVIPIGGRSSNCPRAAAATGAEARAAAGAAAQAEGRAAAGAARDIAPQNPASGLARQRSTLRREYLGLTPGRDSVTGRAVQQRMRQQGLIRDTPNGTEVRASNGTWMPIAETDMAHTTDAMRWWNDVGRQYGPRSPEVRQWMLDPNNYRLEAPRINRSSSGRLRNSEGYLPPTNNGS